MTIACRLNEFEWTESFIHRYKNKLDEKIREDVFQYNLAAFYYEKNDFEKALQLLHTVQFTDTYFALGARSMLMKIYFEMEEDDALDAHFHAFKIYLLRNKVISAYQRKVHLNFIRFTKRCYQLRNLSYTDRKTQIQQKTRKLLKQIQKTKNITNRDWLVKQLVEPTNLVRAF
ncbi:MAG: hypothetical protein WD048_06535 [Chitinophagales bacterium]